MTLDATLSGEFANSYVTASYADSYFASHYVADKTALWATFSTAQKEALLIHAVLFGLENIVCVIPQPKFTFDSYYYNRLTGLGIQYNSDSINSPYKYSSTQNLQFPRSFDINSSGVVYIPEDVKIAQCEQAIYLADQDEDVLENSLKGLKSESISVGSIKIAEEYDSKNGFTSVSPISSQMMKKYTLERVIGSRKLCRG